MKNEGELILAVIIGISGGSGSGKTTFAHKLAEMVNSKNLTILSMDSYYLPTQPKESYTEKGRPNFDHPKAFDWELLHGHLKRLKNDKGILTPVYDFTVSSRSKKKQRIGPTKVIIFEGILSLYTKELRDLLDIKCFLHVDADIRFTRRLHRDIKERGRSLESVIEQYYDSVRPMFIRHLSPQQEYADFIVGEDTDVAASILKAKIREYLHDV